MQIGVKSVEIGARLLLILAQNNQPTSLKNIASRARLAPSSAHRYLVSLMRMRLVQQDRGTRLYDLGAGALDLGVAALGRAKGLSSIEELQRRLRDELDETVALCVWGTYGPVIVGVEETTKPILTTMRVGATLPLFRTATGWIFAAFLARGLLAPVWEHELATRGPLHEHSRQEIEARLEAIRNSRLAFHTGDLVPGVTAVAAPFFDYRGELVAVVSIFGRGDNFSGSPTGPAATLLGKAADKFTKTAAYG